MFAGSISVFTGMRNNAFAITINERNPQTNFTEFSVNLFKVFSYDLSIGQATR
jgi:hypothetical protein